MNDIFNQSSSKVSPTQISNDNMTENGDSSGCHTRTMSHEAIRMNLPPLRIRTHFHNSGSNQSPVSDTCSVPSCSGPLSALVLPLENDTSDKTPILPSPSNTAAHAFTFSQSPPSMTELKAEAQSFVGKGDLNTIPMRMQNMYGYELNAAPNTPVASPVPDMSPSVSLEKLNFVSVHCETSHIPQSTIVLSECIPDVDTGIKSHIPSSSSSSITSNSDNSIGVKTNRVAIPSVQSDDSNSPVLFLVGIISAILNYVIAGASPVVTRYLQKDCKVPPMSINAIANILVISIYVVFCAGRFMIQIVRTAILNRRKFRNNRIGEEGLLTISAMVEQHDTIVINANKKGILGRIAHVAHVLFIEYIFLWLLAMLMMLRSVTNLLSPRFTLATNSQLINLCAPFMVSLMSIIIYRTLVRYNGGNRVAKQNRSLDDAELAELPTSHMIDTRDEQFHNCENSSDDICDRIHNEKEDNVHVEHYLETDTVNHDESPMIKVFSQERLSIGMIVCMAVSLIGGAMIILALSANNVSFFSVPSIHQMVSSLTVYDAIGMSIALLSTFALSMNNIVLKITTMSSSNNNNNNNTAADSASKKTHIRSLSGENLFLFHLLVLGSGYIILCVAMREDLTVWTQLTPLAYGLFVVYALLNYLVGNVVNLMAIKYFGATNTSSILALSLVSTISCSWIILGEKIHNIFQVVGCVLVLLSISVYMIMKRRSIK